LIKLDKQSTDDIMLERLTEHYQDNILIFKRIRLWTILVAMGIIGSVLSLLIIPLSLITIVFGIPILVCGIYFVHGIHYGLNNDKIKNLHGVKSVSKMHYLSNHNVGLALIFSGFVFSWVFNWFVLLCYFRYSNYLFAIYL
jgi:hypothetical protein